MSKLEEAKDILNQLKVPQKQQSDLCGYVILAMADIKKDDKWVNATNKWIRIHDVIRYIREFMKFHMLRTVEKHFANKQCIILGMLHLLKIMERLLIVQIIGIV